MHVGEGIEGMVDSILLLYDRCLREPRKEQQTASKRIRLMTGTWADLMEWFSSEVYAGTP